MSYNGSAVVAMVGKNCVAIAADRRLGAQLMTVSTDFQKIFPATGKCYIGLAGLATDVQTFLPNDKVSNQFYRSEKFRFKINMYKLREEREIEPSTLSNMVASTLYERRFSPFFVEPVVAGLDKNNQPFICTMDLIGCNDISKDFVVAGTASDSLFGMCESLWEPDLEPEDLFETISQALLNAVDRDCLSGWGAVVHVITPERVITRNLKALSENCEETTVDQEGDFDILTFATKEKKSGGGGILKRGIKDSEPDGSIRQNELLTESLNTLQNFLQEERSGSSRQICKATWHPAPINKAHVTTIRGNHFHNMGHSIKGEMWLYPEEALLLMERGALVIDCDDVPMSIQHAYTMLIREWLTLEKYQVYTYLKRIGYTVIRPIPQDSLQTSTSSQEILQGTIIKPPSSYTALSLSHLHEEEINSIVTSESCDTYEQVFNKLQIIQRYDVDLPTDNDQESYNIDFHVYKSSDSSKYKKKNPGVPSFRVVVACAESNQPPVLSTLGSLFKDGNSSVLFAVVDGANISFLEFKDMNFKNVNVKMF
ncbi:1686_t:CDS:10 [Dentiscutata erythropus]|uniref:1686_t:CDS:1 n=1 Tax=Dentiscutata erythropus TaxID=1348616 RepID=A0A9N8Z1Y5_9GLOM|nr:1686_t:CDS:10 [Dentiscutata erythropus]